MRPACSAIWVFLAGIAAAVADGYACSPTSARCGCTGSAAAPAGQPGADLGGGAGVRAAATGTPYPTYFEGAKFVHFLIGPATVALAVPLYAQLERLKRMWLPIGVALLVGSMTAIVSAVAIGRLLGASRESLLSLAPKSSTLPIAMGVAEQIGGVPSLAAMAVAATGIGGAIMATPAAEPAGLPRPGGARLRRRHHRPRHRHRPGDAGRHVNGAFAALALALNGVATALLVPLLLKTLGLLR